MCERHIQAATVNETSPPNTPRMHQTWQTQQWTTIQGFLFNPECFQKPLFFFCLSSVAACFSKYLSVWWYGIIQLLPITLDHLDVCDSIITHLQNWLTSLRNAPNSMGYMCFLGRDIAGHVWMRPLYVAERALEEVETDLSEGQPRYQPAATSPSLPPRSRGNAPLISLVMKLFLKQDQPLSGKLKTQGWCRERSGHHGPEGKECGNIHRDGHKSLLH